MFMLKSAKMHLAKVYENMQCCSLKIYRKLESVTNNFEIKFLTLKCSFKMLKILSK